MSVVIAIGTRETIVVLYHVSIPVVIQVVTSITTVGNKCSMVKPIAKITKICRQDGIQGSQLKGEYPRGTPRGVATGVLRGILLIHRVILAVLLEFNTIVILWVSL